MWVMTSFGILMPSLRPEGTVPEGDDRTLQIRTRRRKDLEILRKEYMGDDLGEIIAIPNTDYEYRAYCTHEAFGKALAKITMDIDFVKFKPTTETKYKDNELHSLYNSIWATVFSQLSTPDHQDSYWTSSTGISGSVGKYGSTYPGTGAFSVKKGKGRKAGTRRYGDDYTPAGRRQPWWADAEGTNETWWEDGDGSELGLGRYSDYIEGDAIMASLRRGAMAPSDVDDFASLMDNLIDMDPNDKPVLTATGNIDHEYCDHGPSKSAKKRCRARWRRVARKHTQRRVGTTIG